MLAGAIAGFSQSTTAGSTPYARPDADARFRGYLKDTLGPGPLFGTIAAAGITTATNSPKEWGGSWDGFGKRAASNLGKSVIKSTVSYGLDEALKLDSRYYRSERSDIRSRFKNALLSPVTARKPNGKRTVGIPGIAGAYASNVIANETWYPARYSWKDGMRSGTISLGVNAITNLFREFVFKR